jgi:hypothetical protein
MSYQDVRHWYEERDDDPEPEPVKVVCDVCGKVLHDPPGAVRTEGEAERRAWEEQRQADYDAAMEAEWRAEADRLARECPWCGRPSPGGVPCAECKAGLEGAEAAQDCEPFSSDAIPW